MSELSIPVMHKRVELTNLVPAINGAEGFTVSGGSGTRSIEASTTHTKYATQSLKMSLGSDCSEVCASSTGTYPLDASHIYYFRIEGYQEVKYGTMEMYFPIAEPKPFNTPAKEAGQWNIYSIVCDRSTFSSGNHKFRIDFNNANPFANAEVWYDGVMIIDLTAACGAGNEPTKEWCDANIPYFNGSYAIDIPVESPIQALMTGLVIPEGEVVEITDANGIVIWAVPDVDVAVYYSGKAVAGGVYGGTTHAWAVINGESFTSSNFPVGTVIRCWVDERYGTGYAKIILNGNTVVQNSGTGSYFYDYTIKEGIKEVSIITDVDGSGTMGFYGTIYITEK